MTEARIVIIDYNSGNLRSVSNAIESIKEKNQEILISNQVEDLKNASHIILPGTGAFADCMAGLKAINFMIDEIKNQVLIAKKPFLGICVGMQILADYGYENGVCDGLALIGGKVVKIDNQNNNLKIPHIGWNDLQIKKQNHPILNGLKSGDFAYFVHSYHFVCDDQNNILATVDYGQKIAAIIEKDNIIATQFHPEKSAAAGLKLLKNFINLN